MIQADALEDHGVSHVSAPGPDGTVGFMAPETVRQTVSGRRRVSKSVDIWALGVMLYQMLHEGRTPFGHYLQKGGPREALLAVASETVNRDAMDFDASNMWISERTRLLLPGDHDRPHNLLMPEIVRALVVSWVGSEFLARVCKRCLVFDVNARIDGRHLRVWVDRAIGWDLRVPIEKSELLQAAFNIASNGMMMQTVDLEIARIGERIGASLFPEIWAPCHQHQHPRQLSSRPRRPRRHQTKEQDHLGSSSPSLRIDEERERLDLEAGGPRRRPRDTTGPRKSRFRRTPLIIVILLSIVLATLFGICGVVFARHSSSSSPPPDTGGAGGEDVKDDGSVFVVPDSVVQQSPDESDNRRPTGTGGSPVTIIDSSGDDHVAEVETRNILRGSSGRNRGIGGR